MAKKIILILADKSLIILAHVRGLAHNYKYDTWHKPILELPLRFVTSARRIFDA